MFTLINEFYKYSATIYYQGPHDVLLYFVSSLIDIFIDI